VPISWCARFCKGTKKRKKVEEERRRERERERERERQEVEKHAERKIEAAEKRDESKSISDFGLKLLHSSARSIWTRVGTHLLVLFSLFSLCHFTCQALFLSLFSLRVILARSRSARIRIVVSGLSRFTVSSKRGR